MQNANYLAARPHRGAACLLAFSILHFAFVGCASTPSRRSEPSARAIAQLRTDILAITDRPGVNRASWGVVVASLQRHDRLVDLNSQTLFVPASIAKLISVASAADAVGWDFRFETQLVAGGPIDQGTLTGDLVIVGHGDPSIDGRGGGQLSSFIAAVKAAGISKIEGRIIGDDNAVEEPRPQLAWAWDDLGYTTGAMFGGLNLGENRTSVLVIPGAAEGAATTVIPEPRAVTRPITNRSITGAKGSQPLLWPEQRPGESFLTIAGSIPLTAQPAQLAISVGNPTLWFASVLRQRLVDEGVVVTGEPIDIDDVVPVPGKMQGSVLLTYRSPTLAEIARPLLKESINLYGEAFLRLNAESGAFPTNDAALEGLRARLGRWGVPEDSYQLVDGSGLSRRNAISPQTVLTVLERMFDGKSASPFINALPVAGVDGSLAARLKSTAAEGNVKAKTGTMSNIRSLAGYVTSRDGESLAFVIVVNNFEGTGAAANEAIDAIAVRLAEFSR